MHVDEKWIGLISTLAWILFYTALMLVFRTQVGRVVQALSLRIQGGAGLKLGIFEMSAAAAGLPAATPGAATAEGRKGAQSGDGVAKEIEERKFPPGVNEELCLVHEAQVVRAPIYGKAGLFKVRVHLESVLSVVLPDDVVRVTYGLLHDSFSQKTIATESRESSFELWLNLYGEILLIAVVERKNKPNLWVARYLDLPGRPTN